MLILGWMNMIFGFSAATDVESQSLSDKITIKVVKIINSDYDNLTSKEQSRLFDQTSFLVRKMGHFSEYTILGILASLFLYTFESIRRNKKFGWQKIMIVGAALWALLYAVSDEIHQGFVQGRSPEVRDVIIDLTGGLLGACVVWAIIKLVNKHKNNK